MRVHTASISRSAERQAWRTLKARIIARFGTIKAAANQIECHPNSLRLAASGHCPDVITKLEALLAK